MKTQNPGMRIYAETALGPRTEVVVSQSTSSTLKKPKSYFVELGVFRKDNPEKAAILTQDDIVWESIDGAWVQGVPGLKLVRMLG